MNTKDYSEFDSITASLDLIKLSGGKGLKEVIIDTIPEEKSRFMDSNSFWKNAHVEDQFENKEDVSSCYYWGSPKDEFDSHIHPVDEWMYILNPKGSYKYIQANGKRGIAKFGEVIHFPANEGHWIDWLTDTYCLIIWSPSFEKGWGGKFKG